MRRSRRMWASLHRHPTSPAAAAFPLDRSDKPGGRTLSQLKSRDELTPDELDDQDCEELAARQAMSLIGVNAAAPVKAAAALNVLSDDSTAVADAEQSAEIHES
jgi:hypothetical protein